MTSTDAPSPTGGAPAVGNILGLGLLLRDRTVVLSLERRGLEPGVRVRDLEAEIRHVPFPLAGALSAARFRHHRSRLLRATLQFDARLLLPRIVERLRDLYVDVVDATVVDVDVELRDDTRAGHVTRELAAGVGAGRDDEHGHDDVAPPTVVVELQTRHGGVLHLVVPFTLVPAGAHVELHPLAATYVGRAAGVDLSTAIEAWKRLAEQLQPEAHVHDGVVAFDPACSTLIRPFASAGWRAPDLTGIHVESITIERRAIHVELRRKGEAVEPRGAGVREGVERRSRRNATIEPRGLLGERGAAAELAVTPAIVTALDVIHTALDRGERASALRRLEALSQGVSPRSPLRLALVRWRADLGQLHDRAASIAALREWLELRPRDPTPRRRLVAVLAALGEANALAQLLLAERREQTEEQPRDALDLGLAALLAGALGDPRSAMSILVPMTARLRRDPSRRADLEAALVGLAEARAIDALEGRDGASTAATSRTGGRLPHVQAALDEACVLVEDAERRMEMRLRIARRLARHGGDGAALRMIAQALAEARPPRDDTELERARQSAHAELLELAVETATRLRQTDVAAEFARHRLLLAGSRDRGVWRRRRIELLADAEDSATLRARLDLIEEALQDEPDAVDLLREAFDLADRCGDEHDALRHGWALLDRLDDERDDVVDVRLKMSRILLATRDEHAAWDMLRPLLAREDVAGERLHTTLELALALAPAFDRARILDRLIDVAEGPRLGRALVERADLAMTPAQRWADLERALEAGADPHAVLSRMEGALDPEDAPNLAHVAALARTHGVSTVELRVLVRQGRHLARHLRWDEAVAPLQRARELAPERDDVTVALGEAFVELGRARDGLAVLEPFLDPERAANAGASASVVALRMARAALSLGDDVRAADLLARARAGLSSAELAFSTLAEELFDVLYRLGRSEEAGALARDMAAHAEGHARANWLLRSAEFERDEARLHALFEAATLAPHDPEILDALEAELRARLRWADLDALFESRLTRVVEPSARVELLERWVSGRHVDSIPAENLALVVDACEELLSFRPADAKLELQLADFLERVGDGTSASEHRRRAIAALPLDDVDAARAAFALASSALRDGDVEQARRHCARARAGGLRSPALARLEADVARTAEDDRALLSSLVELLELTAPVTGGETAAPASEGWTLERDVWSSELVELALANHELDLAAQWLAARCEGSQLDRRERERRFEAWIDFARNHDRLHDERVALARRRDLLGEAWNPAEFSREILRLAGPLDRFEEAMSRVTARLLERPDDEELHRLLLEITKEPARLPRRIAAFEAVVRAVRVSERPVDASMEQAETAPVDPRAVADDSSAEALASPSVVRALIDSLERTSAELDVDGALHCLELAWSIAAPVDRVTLLAEALARCPSDDRVAATILSTTAELRGEPATPPWSNAVIGQSFALVDGIARSRALDEDSRTAARMALVGMLQEETAIEMLVALARAASFGSAEREAYVDALSGRGRWRDVLELLRAEVVGGAQTENALGQVRGLAESAERTDDVETARLAWALLLSALPRAALEERLHAVRAASRLGVETTDAAVLALARDLLATGRAEEAVEIAAPHVSGLADALDTPRDGTTPSDADDAALLQTLCEAHLRGAIPRRHVPAVVRTLATRAALDPTLALTCETLAGRERDGSLSLVRGWTESLPPGPLRARHATRLLELGRAANAPRAVAQAIEALQSDASAGVDAAVTVVEAPAFVDHRTWLARSLGLVEDEVARLETALLSTAQHEMAWRGLTSLREGDVDAAVRGVLARWTAQIENASAALTAVGAGFSTPADVVDGDASATPAGLPAESTAAARHAVQFLRDTVPPASLSPTVRLQLLRTALDLGSTPAEVRADVDELVVDADAALLPALRSLSSRLRTAADNGGALAEASRTVGEPLSPRPALDWVEALARRVLGKMELDEASWQELLDGASLLHEDVWTPLFDAVTLIRPRADRLALVERRLDEPSWTPTEALVLRYLALQPMGDLVLELPRISAGPSEWFARHDESTRALIASATERAVAWMPTAWHVRDVRRIVATSRVSALDQHGDHAAAAVARVELERILQSDVALADANEDRERSVALRIALLDAKPADVAVTSAVLRWFRENDEPAPLRAALLDGLDAIHRSDAAAADTTELDVARIELLATSAADTGRLREALTAFFERHGPAPRDEALQARLGQALHVADGFAAGSVRAALADALQTTVAERRVVLASALLRRALDEGDATSLRRALEAGAPLQNPEDRTRALGIASGNPPLRASLRWFVLQSLAQAGDDATLRAALVDLVRLTDAFERAGSEFGDVTTRALEIAASDDDAHAGELATELSPWLGDLLSQSPAPHRAALARVFLDTLLEPKALEPRLVAACTIAVAAASEAGPVSPWRGWSTSTQTWLGEGFLDELVRAGAHDLARRFAEDMASAAPTDERVRWLVRAAELTADERAALAAIDAAVRVEPADERLVRMQEAALERALTTARDEPERRSLRRRLAQLRPDDTVLASKVIDDLLVEGEDDAALELATRLRETLATSDGAIAKGALLDGVAHVDDTRLDLAALLDVSSTIARVQTGRGEHRAAFEALAPFFPPRGGSDAPSLADAAHASRSTHLPTRIPPGVASLALGIARQLDEPNALVRVLASLVATTTGPTALAMRDELASALEVTEERLVAATEWLTAARASPPASDDRRRRALRAFTLTHGSVDTATRTAAEEEIALEATLLLLETGPAALSTDDVTAVATCLWSHERGAQAIAFVGDALRSRPDDDALLTTQRELCAVMARPIDWYDALSQAIGATSGGARRDGLALELAYVGVELEDPTRTLDALASITGPLESSPEVLDLRDWAMRRLGRGDDEVRAILEAWAADAKDHANSTRAVSDVTGRDRDDALLQGLRRAARILDGDRMALVRRVMDHAANGDEGVARRLRVTLVTWLASDDPTDFVATETRVAAVQEALGRIAADDPAALRELFRATVATAADAEASDVAAFLAIADRHDTLVPPPEASLGDVIIASALTRFPDATNVVDAFLDRLDESTGGPSAAPDATTPAPAGHGEGAAPARDKAGSRSATSVDAALARILPSVGLRPRLTARTWISVSARLDRREGSALLLRRAVAWALDEPEAHDALVDALAERSAWPELVAVLDALASNEAAPLPRRVAAYKRLAHVRLDVLGDDDGVVRELEAALVLAPEDPDLLLPLLDHHYARRDLGPALDLSRRVMAHVPMGDAAFVALGLRTADAALAWGDSKLAETVLESILARCPGERRVQSRLGELRSETASPEHRVRMLAAVASRQTGVARRDALEERARLLVSPLGRFDEAITELELLLADGGLRPELHDLLVSLYTQRSRWSELAELLERDYPRKQGTERATILRRLAGVYGDRLYDLPRAEQALRLALENLDAERLTTDLDGRVLRDELSFDMVRVLELQGRYGELASTLEHELRAELANVEDGELPDTPPEGRIRLLEQLARVLRDYVEDESRTARVYERLRQFDRLPDDGLAVLARWYRAERRFDDLVHILELRSSALAASGDLERKAEIDRRIGDLLEGPLRRPREAARWFLDAYLASPDENASAGAKARVLLAGTDAIENVRKLLLTRIDELPQRSRPAALTLLGDLLAPQESFEAEAERHYRAALEGDPGAGPASEGLGRLLARQGRLDAAADPLLRAATSDRLAPERAADVAAIAARVLFELGRIGEAERVLRHAVGRAPDAQRALLELARLYSRTRRASAEAEVLDRLSDLPLSSMLRAEVAYRRAMLLEADFVREPNGVAGEQAKAWLLEAVGADAMHAQARQTLLGLATARNEWSIVAHMHFLAIRELPPGPSRALAHLDLAEVYLDRLGDSESALRNLGAALTSPTSDLVAERRAHALAMRFPDAGRACAHLGKLAVEDGELPPARRVKLLLLAAELALRSEDPSTADPLLQRALSTEGATDEDREAARRLRASLSREDVELRRQRNALLKLLEAEEHPGERLHILVRLREIGHSLSDHDLVASVTGDLQVLAEAMFDQEGERDAAFLALRELLGERGDYPRLVELHERMAEASTDDVDSARLLVEAARVAWSGLRDPSHATRLVLRALLAAPDLMEAATLLSELGRSDDATLDALVVDELERIPTHRLGEDLVVRLAMAALRRDREDLAESTLRRALSSSPPERRAPLLDALDALLARRGDTEARMEVLQQRIRHARVHARARVPDIAFELARAQKASGAIDAARHTVSEALALAPTHMELARLEASLLEVAEDWASLAAALERIAELSTSDDDRANWITRAAKVHLAHPTGEAPGLERVRGLLDRARKTSIHARDARALLIPISFGAGDWPLVLELTVELRAVHGDDDEALIFGALVEALVAGRRTVARAVGARHERNVRMRMMWPAAARLLDVVATEGPLERLDALLGAIGALVGSTEDALAELSTFVAASPLRAGTALALARLHEAIGRSELARYWYQLVAFLAPQGPVPGLADRLATPEVPRDPLHVEGWTPLGWRGPLRETLIELRGPFAQMRLQGGTTRAPATSEEVELLRRCDETLQRWREPFEFDLAVALTDDAVHAGIGARNLLPPTLVVSPDFARLPRGEQAFRLAVQAVALASGLGVAVDTHPVDLTDMLDALALLCGVELTPANPTASSIVDALAARGVRPTSLTPELRRALRDELGHWRSTPTALAQLVATIRRAFLAVALRVSGRLDGALSTLARDLGLVDESGRVDVPATLAADDAQWLLRELGLLA